MILPLPSLWIRPLKDVVTGFTSEFVSQVIGFIFKAGFKDLNYILDNGIFNEWGLSWENPLLCGVSFLCMPSIFFIAFVVFFMITVLKSPKRRKRRGWLQTQLTMRFYAKLEIY